MPVHFRIKPDAKSTGSTPAKRNLRNKAVPSASSSTPALPNRLHGKKDGRLLCFGLFGQEITDASQCESYERNWKLIHPDTRDFGCHLGIFSFNTFRTRKEKRGCLRTEDYRGQ